MLVIIKIIKLFYQFNIWIDYSGFMQRTVFQDRRI